MLCTRPSKDRAMNVRMWPFPLHIISRLFAAVRIDILNLIIKLFSAEPQLKHTFRQGQGFVCVISIFTSFRDPATNQLQQTTDAKLIEHKHELVKAVFKTLTTALEKNTVNKHYFLNEVGYTILADTLKLSGLLQSDFASEIYDHLFAMATETASQEVETYSTRFILNAHVVDVIIRLVVLSSIEVQTHVIARILDLAKKESNAQQISTIGFVDLVTELFSPALSDPDHVLFPLLTQIIRLTITYRISASALRIMFRLREHPVPLLYPEASVLSLRFLRIVAEACLGSIHVLNAPFLDINLTKGTSGLVIPALAHIPGPNALPTDRPWPPANGFSFATWMRIENVGEQPANFLTLYCPGEQETVLLSFTIEPGTRFLTVRTTEELTLIQFRFEHNQWYHIGVTCARSKFRLCQLSYFVDGRPIQTARHPYVGKGPRQPNLDAFQSMICARIGLSARTPTNCSTAYQVAAQYFFDDVFHPSVFQILHHLGPSHFTDLQAALKNLNRAEDSQNTVKQQTRSFGAQEAMSMVMQDWDFMQQRKETTNQSRVAPFDGHVSTMLVTTNTGVVDLNQMIVPGSDEPRVWISLHIQQTSNMTLAALLETIGTGDVLTAFTRELGESDPLAFVPTLKSVAFNKDLIASLTGRARIFCPSTVLSTIDQVCDSCYCLLPQKTMQHIV